MARLRNEFALVCTKTSARCACDFRVNLRGCPEENIIYTASIILLPYLLLISAISVAFIYDQVHVKRQSVLFPSRERGIIRTKPQFSFNIAVCVFHLVQAISLLLLILDAFPNAVYAEFFAYFSREVGYALAVFYPISIVYSTPGVHSSYTIQSQWKPKNQYLDLFAIYLIIGPFISNVPLSLITGHYVDAGNISSAKTLYISNSVVWCLWTLQYVAILLYVYYKLVSNMRDVITSLQQKYRNDSEIDFVIRRLKMAGRLLSWTVGCVALVFFIHTLENLFFGFLYHNLLRSHPTRNLFYYSLWYLTIPIICNISQIAMYYYYYKQQSLTSDNPPDASHHGSKVRLEIIHAKINSPNYPYSHENLSSFGSTLVNSSSKQSAPSSGTTIVSSGDIRFLGSRSNLSSPNLQSKGRSSKCSSSQSLMVAMYDYNLEESETIGFVEERNVKDNEKRVRMSWLMKEPVRTK